MKDDVSAIPTNGCSVLTGEKSLSNYIGNTRRDYIFNGGRWYAFRTQNSIQNYDVSAYNCVDIYSLSTNAIYEPFLYLTAFIVFIFSIYMFFKTIKGFLYGFN